MDALVPVVKLPLAAPRRLLKLRSDAALLERFAAGDEGAFAVLYERHRAGVFAVCAGVLGAGDDTEDAVQESFANLALSVRSSPPRELRPWLARVARNAAIDIARTRKRTVTTDGLPDVAAAPQGGGTELETVLAGIRELPENQRMALLMRELGGHSYLEIAALLEVDEEAVRGLIARARVGLRAYREACDLPCATARAAIQAEPDGRRHDRTVRRHLRSCPSCRAYRRALRSDARALRSIVPAPAGGMAGGSALAGSFVAKGAILGVGVTQVTAACAASVCAVGGMVFLYPHHGRLPLPSATPQAASAKARHDAARDGGARALSAPVSFGVDDMSAAAPGARLAASAAAASAHRSGARSRAASKSGGAGIVHFRRLAPANRNASVHVRPRGTGGVPVASPTTGNGSGGLGYGSKPTAGGGHLRRRRERFRQRHEQFQQRHRRRGHRRGRRGRYHGRHGRLERRREQQQRRCQRQRWRGDRYSRLHLRRLLPGRRRLHSGVQRQPVG